MKRIQLEPWTPYDKLSLASAVIRTGDQNWNAVARATRNIFEESMKYMIEEKRSQEWFSNKQCAAQYEALLKNIGPRRKKKVEKSGAEHIGDSPNDIIMHAVKQECIEELKRSLASSQALYLKLHKEYEDIQAGKMDHKLEEMIEEYEAKEREKEIKMKLKFKLGEKNPEIMENSANIKTEDSDIKKTLDKEPPVSEPAKTNLTTSPLLTSLLQSPSPLTRPSLPPNTSPTISLLLNSSPSVPTSESPTLTKLLEASSSVVGSQLMSGHTSTTSQVTTKQDSGLSSVSNSAVVVTTSATTPVTAQTAVTVSSSPLLPVSSLTSESVPSTTTDSNTVQPPCPTTVISPVITTTSVTSVTSSIVPTTIVTPSSPVTSPTTASGNVIATTVPDKSQPSSPNVNADYEQVSEEVVVKSETSSEDTKVIEESKETEIEEVANPTTPEIVLEDIVHSVVESEVVIDQETPTSKRKGAARRLQLEQVEENETDDEVMETVEQIIEKVEEAIIETVGEETAEIDLALNQSSETDNLSDHIETLELDSHAVELIVLGHNQGKVITIRHDTEIGSDPVKSDPSVDEVTAPLDSFEDIESLVEEEVRTCEEKIQEVEETVEEVEEEEEEIEEEEDIKIQEEIVEHEEIVEDKELEEIAEVTEDSVVASNIELEEEKVVEEKDEITVKEVEQEKEVKEAEEEIKVEDDDSVKEQAEIEAEESTKEISSDNKKENDIIDNENIQTDLKDDDVMEVTNHEEVKVEEIKDVENVSNEEAKTEEEALVEEAPEEVVIAELVEEVVQAEKLRADKVNNQEESSTQKTETPDHQDTDLAIKEEVKEDNSTEIFPPVSSNEVQKVPKFEEGPWRKTDDAATPKKEEEVLEPAPKEEENVLPVLNDQNNRSSQQDTVLDSKDTTRTPGKLEENISSTRNKEHKNDKIEKNLEPPKVVETKPNQEMEKRRTGRKRYPLAGCADSKPNSPAPSLHSIEDDREYKAWKKSIMLVYNRLAAHKYASVFLKPITEAEASGYHNVVLRPMDLTTIKRNIETGVIRSTVEFQRDMILMAQNAMIYNKADSLVFKMAEDMLADMMSQMEVMVQALGDGVPLWGDSDEKLHTRGRASKVQFDDSSGQKRRSQTDDTPSRRRQQTEDSAKKRKGQQQQQEDVVNKRKTEDNKKKSISDDNSKRKSLEESFSKKKSQPEDSGIKKKGQSDDSSGKKKTHSDDSNSARKKTVTEDTSSTKRKLQTDDGIKKAQSEDTPTSGKRKTQQIEEHQNKRKNETPGNKRKSQVDETPSKRKNMQVEDTPVSKRKAHVDETPTNKRKRSSAAASEEPRSTTKRKRTDAL